MVEFVAGWMERRQGNHLEGQQQRPPNEERSGQQEKAEEWTMDCLVMT